MLDLTEIKIFGEIFRVRRTYDINNSGIGYYGFDIYDEEGNFLDHFAGERISDLKQYIKMIFFKSYESTYSHHK